MEAKALFCRHCRHCGMNWGINPKTPNNWAAEKCPRCGFHLAAEVPDLPSAGLSPGLERPPFKDLVAEREPAVATSPLPPRGLDDVQAKMEAISAEVFSKAFAPAVAKYADGAVRSARKPRYDKIPFEGFYRLAKRYGMGCDKPEYGPDGDNWKAGNSDFWRDAGNHATEHLALYLRGDRSDDHLAAVAWYCFSRMWREAREGESKEQA